jgi:signal peptidase
MIKAEITLPNAALLKPILDFLEQGRNIIIPVKGNSMWPFLREKDRVLLEPFETKTLRKGLIVLGKQGEEMILHRVVRFSTHTIWLAGDNNLVQHEQLAYRDVLAIAIYRYRDRQELKLNAAWQCHLGQLWYWLRPLRRVIVKLFKIRY